MTSTSPPTSTKNLLFSAYKAAISAVQPSSLIQTAVNIDPETGILKTTDQRCSRSKKVTEIPLLGREGQIYLIGAGKAVLGMATELLRKVEEFNQKINLNSSQPAIIISKGQLNIPHGSLVSKEDISLLGRHSVTFYKAARNNLPDEDSVAATQKVLNLIKEAKKISSKNSQNSLPPLVLAFISGGGSALLSLPRPPSTLADKQAVIADLMHAGADIVALNTVRGRLSMVKHGQLAEVVLSKKPLELVTFLISDIIGDPIDKIASGPTVLFPEEEDVHKERSNANLSPLEVLQKFNVTVDDKIKPLMTTLASKTDDQLQNSTKNLLHNIIVGNNSLAVAAAQMEVQKWNSKQKKFKIINHGSEVCGDVRKVVKELLDCLEVYGKEVSCKEEKFTGVCLLAGGETTVDMTENSKNIGLGGRCQEMGLLFLKHMLTKNVSQNSKVFSRITVLFGGTDGQDGPTSAAGVLLSWPLDDNQNYKFLKNGNKDFEDAIKRHDSNTFFRSHFLPENCPLIETGPSGTNVMDLYALIGEF